MHFELKAEEIVGKVILKFQKISGKSQTKHCGKSYIGQFRKFRGRVRQSTAEIVGKVILRFQKIFGEKLDKALWEKLYWIFQKISGKSQTKYRGNSYLENTLVKYIYIHYWKSYFEISENFRGKVRQSIVGKVIFETENIRP